MICRDCADAADVDRQSLHCGKADCTCQHKPMRWLVLSVTAESDKAMVRWIRKAIANRRDETE